MFGPLSFPGMVRPIECSPIYLSLEEVTVHAGHKVLMEVDYILLAVGDPQGIFDQHLNYFGENILTFCKQDHLINKHYLSHLQEKFLAYKKGK